MRFLSSLKPVTAALVALLTVSISMNADSAPSKQFLVYFGTYTGSKSNGIYVSRFDTASGELSTPTLAAKSVNPAYVAIDPNHRFLFAVNETDHFNGQAGGAVTAFRLDASTGKLEFLNQQPSGGTQPLPHRRGCHR